MLEQSFDRAPRDASLARATEGIVARLYRRGILLLRHDTSDELARLLDAVERFEKIVERNGADLMVDEPLEGMAFPVQPDDRAFVIPLRAPSDSVDEFIDKIADAAANAAQVRHRAVRP